MTNFAPGQLVECIKSIDRRAATGELNGYGDEILPQKGIIYTVRDGVAAKDCRSIPCIRLVEIVNPAREYIMRLSGRNVCGEPAFQVHHFRPVDPRRLDVFRKIEASIWRTPA